MPVHCYFTCLHIVRNEENKDVYIVELSHSQENHQYCTHLQISNFKHTFCFELFSLHAVCLYMVSISINTGRLQCIFFLIIILVRLRGPRGISVNTPKIPRFTVPTWGPPGSRRSQMGPMLAPWTLLSGTPLAVAEVYSEVGSIQFHLGKTGHEAISRRSRLMQHNHSEICSRDFIW